VHAYWYRSRPLLGIAYIAAYLESKCIECRIFDAQFHGWNKTQLTEKVIAWNPQVIGFSAMTHEIAASHELALLIRNTAGDIPIVIGGCHVAALPSQTLKEFPAFTYGVYGEGEKNSL